MTTHHFAIAEMHVQLIFAESKYNSLRLLPSITPFRCDADTPYPHLFTLTIDDTLKSRPREERERIRDFDTGNGVTVVDHLKNGGYQFIIRDVKGYDCCLLQSNEDFSQCYCALNGNYDMRCYGLNNALMLATAFAGSFHSILLIHASLVRHRGHGYAFIAKSGTGKSTQVSNWLRYIPDCDLMNDDNPIVRVVGDESFIYGSPWSGKTPCYRSVKAPLGAITRIDRATANSVERLSAVEAFASVLPSCSSMKWDSQIYDGICSTVARVVETTGIYILHCLPDRESAEVCCAGIAQPFEQPA